MRNGNFAVLMAALLFVRNLVFDLQCAGTGFDHFLGEQIGCFGVTETGVDIGDDRHDMRLEILYLVEQGLFLGGITRRTGGVDVAEEEA